MQVSETMSLNNYFNKEYFGPTPMWSCDWPFWVKNPYFDKSYLIGRYFKKPKGKFCSKLNFSNIYYLLAKTVSGIVDKMFLSG